MDFKTPLITPEIVTKPPIDGRQQLDPDMQQAISLLCGHYDSVRKLLACLPSGALCVVSQRLNNIYHVTATSGSFAYQGGDIPCSEVMIMGHPDNTGRVWVECDTAALTTNGWPLAKGEWFVATLTNLNQLRLLIATTTEKAIIAYTR